MINHNYIVTFGNDGIVVYGPFKTQDEIKEFGNKWQYDRDDDPRWNSIYIDEKAINSDVDDVVRYIVVNVLKP